MKFCAHSASERQALRPCRVTCRDLFLLGVLTTVTDEDPWLHRPSPSVRRRSLAANPTSGVAACAGPSYEPSDWHRPKSLHRRRHGQGDDGFIDQDGAECDATSGAERPDPV